MGCKKRYLSLLLLMCITSSVFVGCSNKEALSSNNSEEVEVVNSSNSDNQEVSEESGKATRITKEEALKLVEKEVLKVFPNAKLKIKSDEYPNREGFYVIQYDTAYCTTAEFVVDPYTGYVQACEEGTTTYIDMDEWKKDIERYLGGETFDIITGEEAMAKFVSQYNYNETHERGGWFRLSDNQLNNFELVSSELVEYKSGACGWVFRYPMEEEHTVFENDDDIDCTKRNAVNKDDKYAYIYFEPQMLNSTDNMSWYYAHICDGDGTYFYWEKKSLE